jgi:hypothetical protein
LMAVVMSSATFWGTLSYAQQRQHKLTSVRSHG